MKWSAFRAHVAHWYEEAAARSSEGPGRARGFAGGEPPRYPPPPIDELRDTPFEGDEDPLEELFRQ